MSQTGRICGHLSVSRSYHTLPFHGHCHMPCAWDCAEYVVGVQEVRWTAKMNGDIKYLACPTQRLKHNRNSITKIATLALLIKINLPIFPSPGCVLVGRGPQVPGGPSAVWSQVVPSFQVVAIIPCLP